MDSKRISSDHHSDETRQFFEDTAEMVTTHQALNAISLIALVSTIAHEITKPAQLPDLKKQGIAILSQILDNNKPLFNMALEDDDDEKPIQCLQVHQFNIVFECLINIEDPNLIDQFLKLLDPLHLKIFLIDLAKNDSLNDKPNSIAAMAQYSEHWNTETLIKFTKILCVNYNPHLEKALLTLLRCSHARIANAIYSAVELEPMNFELLDLFIKQYPEGFSDKMFSPKTPIALALEMDRTTRNFQFTKHVMRNHFDFFLSFFPNEAIKELLTTYRKILLFNQEAIKLFFDSINTDGFSDIAGLKKKLDVFQEPDEKIPARKTAAEKDLEIKSVRAQLVTFFKKKKPNADAIQAYLKKQPIDQREILEHTMKYFTDLNAAIRDKKSSPIFAEMSLTRLKFIVFCLTRVAEEARPEEIKLKVAQAQKKATKT